MGTLMASWWKILYWTGAVGSVLLVFVGLFVGAVGVQPVATFWLRLHDEGCALGRRVSLTDGEGVEPLGVDAHVTLPGWLRIDADLNQGGPGAGPHQQPAVFDLDAGAGGTDTHAVAVEPLGQGYLAHSTFDGSVLERENQFVRIELHRVELPGQSAGVGPNDPA